MFKRKSRQREIEAQIRADNLTELKESEEWFYELIKMLEIKKQEI